MNIEPAEHAPLALGRIEVGEPDAKVLDQIYRHELLWRIPRVESR